MTLSRPVTTRNFYTPTCSLEVQVPKTPLWAHLLPSFRQQLVRFKLVLDDPCCPRQAPRAIQGDRARLSALYTKVAAITPPVPGATAALELDGLEADPASPVITLSERQLADLVATLEQCALEVWLDLEPELAGAIVPKRAPQLRFWATAGTVAAIVLGGAWLAREQLAARSGDRNFPTITEEVSAPASNSVPLPPPRSIDLQLQEPAAPTFEAAPLSPPDPVGRPST